MALAFLKAVALATLKRRVLLEISKRIPLKLISFTTESWSINYPSGTPPASPIFGTLIPNTLVELYPIVWLVIFTIGDKFMLMT